EDVALTGADQCAQGVLWYAPGSTEFDGFHHIAGLRFHSFGSSLGSLHLRLLGRRSRGWWRRLGLRRRGLGGGGRLCLRNVLERVLTLWRLRRLGGLLLLRLCRGRRRLGTNGNRAERGKTKDGAHYAGAPARDHECIPFRSERFRRRENTGVLF